jgi:hypothetical protein
VRIDALQSILAKTKAKIALADWEDAVQVSAKKRPLSNHPDNEAVLKALIADSKTLIDRPPLL